MEQFALTAIHKIKSAWLLRVAAAALWHQLSHICVLTGTSFSLVTDIWTSIIHLKLEKHQRSTDFLVLSVTELSLLNSVPKWQSELVTGGT